MLRSLQKPDNGVTDTMGVQFLVTDLLEGRTSFSITEEVSDFDVLCNDIYLFL